MKNKLVAERNDGDFGLIVCSAVRYAIGRYTYLPPTVIAFVIDNIALLSNQDINNIIQDIGRETKLGPKDLEKEWLDLKDFLEKEIIIRGIK